MSLLTSIPGCAGLEPDCRVETGGPIISLEEGPAPTTDALQSRGPHDVWSTQPHPSCSQNPRIQAAHTDTEIELLISYPSASDPLQSGYGDVAAGQWPVVLFGHANTYADCNLVDAYSTLHEHWASWGFIVVSVDASPLCEKNSKANLEGRRDDLLAAWESVGQMAADPGSILYNHVDPDRLVLAGHSRGATAALLASQHLDEASGLIWLQGVDTAGYQLGRPQLAIPALGVVAGLDLDIRFPRAEPTKDQLVGPHAWVTLLGGIHAFTSDRIPAREKDEPELQRSEQLALSARLSTLLLATAIGVSDGARIVEMPEATDLLFGPDTQTLHSAIHATWERGSEEVVWIDDFQSGLENNMLGGSWQAEPPESATRTLAWTQDEEDPGSILGDTFVLQITGVSTVSFTLSADPNEVGTSLPQGSLLVFLVKDLEADTLKVQVETDSGLVEHTIGAPDPRVDPRLYRQVELALAKDAPTRVDQFFLELAEGQAIVDDFRLVLP